MSEKVANILQELAYSYQKKVTPDSKLIIQILLQPDGESWSVVFGKDQEPLVYSGTRSDSRFVFLLSEDVLEQLHTGHLSPLTAAGRAHISETAPLDFKLGEGLTLTPEIYLELIEFSQRFFNPSTPERIRFGIEHSRVAHGGHAVALFYGQGFRSAWYQLEKGEQLNEPGETNPFPQSFIFLSGQGQAKFGEDNLMVEPNSAYLIPPETEHIIWNENDEPLTLLFLAWGEGA
jgi:mannose-6-phosphate isomerase-like protein (cupin superfamily)